MPQYPFKVLAYQPGGSILETIEVSVPYATTALLYSQLQNTTADAIGVVRYKDGRVVVQVYQKQHMAMCTSATHGFIITRNHLSLEFGLTVPGMKALNPDIAFSDPLGLLNVPSGTLAANTPQPLIWTKDEITASAHSDAQFVEFPRCMATGTLTAHTIQYTVTGPVHTEIQVSNQTLAGRIIDTTPRTNEV